MVKSLIVEDNTEFRDFLKQLVRGRFPDAEIAEADNGPQALHIMGGFQPTIVLIDIALPGGMNGLALTGRIRERGTLPPILVITNHALPEYREAAMRLGADDFLPKHSSAKEIVSVIEQLVSGGAAAPGA